MPSEIAIARRAITSDTMAVVGYELVVDTRDPALDPWRSTRGTSELFAGAFGDVGLDALVGATPAWVPVARGFLVELGLPPVRPDRVVLQVAAADGPVPTALYDAVMRIVSTGYTVALAGYDGGDEAAPLLPVCGLVTVDVGSLPAGDVARAAARARAHGAALAAVGVDDPASLELYRSLGFTLFSGGLFSAPNVVRRRSIGGGEVDSLVTLAELCAPDVPFERVEEIISRDVALALKLLRYVNSAFFSLPREVASVREALAMLGPRMVRRWALVMVLAGSTSKPEGLIALALQRARMCEAIAAGATSDVEEQRESLFTVGLFSVADALLDRPMDEILSTLPFGPELQEALLTHSGPKGELLSTVLAFERGDFETVAARFGGQNMSTFAARYRQATQYADEIVRSLRG